MTNSNHPLRSADPFIPKLKARASGVYARSLYLPVSRAARALRGLSRSVRGVHRQHEQRTHLPMVAWADVFPARPIYLTQTQKRAGNVTVGELAVLATAAAAMDRNDEIVEIGTFDGRTTLNFAINAPVEVPVFTLDLPPDVATRFTLAPGERAFVDKPAPGARFRGVAPPWSAGAARITQILGDSATYDWSLRIGRAGLVFVDGSHAYDYAKCDSETALRLVGHKGVVIWHDYGVWEGVTRALEEIEAKNHFGLRHISGTTLAVFKA
jgi:hypothetical protein